MLGKALNIIIVACVIVGLYKAFGGDISAFMTSAGDIILTIVDAGSDIVAQIWNAIFK